MSPLHIRLIVNPAGGRGKAIDLLPAIDKTFAALGVQADVHISENPDDAAEIARRAASCGYPRVVAVGGDGTVNMVARGILGTDAVLGVIPAGLGNDFFKLLKIGKDLTAACEAAAFGKIAAFDVGVVDAHPFFNMLGVGFDAEVAREANSITGSYGTMTYLLALYRTWKKLPAFTVRLRIDNLVMQQEVMLVAVGIGRSTGGLFRLAPYAVANDGKFDVCIVRKTNRSRGLTLALNALRGKHIHYPETVVYRCRQIEISSETEMPVHYEGETLTMKENRIVVRMSAHKLKVACGVKEGA